MKTLIDRIDRLSKGTCYSDSQFVYAPFGCANSILKNECSSCRGKEVEIQDEVASHPPSQLEISKAQYAIRSYKNYLKGGKK
ncbi:hypothetical protein QUF75_01995 [Desulfococcaceae bacterium HSG7]|nr:hypothetical protein [Desulfococcaceae bacterium HSG7]